MDQLLQIDTHGTCLICLKIICDDDKLQTENHDEESTAVQRVSSTRLKLFLRFLKVDVSKLTETTTGKQEGRAGAGSLQFLECDVRVPPSIDMIDNLELSATTCNTCSSIMNDFSELFQYFEKLRLRLLECVETVHDLIKEGEGDEERVREFRRRKLTAAPTQSSRGDGEGVLKLNVERLRRETLEKCALRKKQSIPQIVVKRQSIDEDCDGDGGNSPSSSQTSEDQDLDDEDDEEPTNELLLTDDEDNEEDEVTPEERSTQSSMDFDRIVRPVSYGEPGSNNHVTKYRCTSCPREFFRVETLLKHQENYHSSNDNFVLEFSSEFGKLSCVRSSSARPPQPHNPAKKSKPDTSPTPSPKERNFIAASARLPNGGFKCTVCEREFATRLNCYEHYKGQHQEKCFKCSFCGQLMLQRIKYEAHLLLAHPLQSIRLELPKYTSGQQLKQVLAAICKKKRAISSSSSFYGCPVCPRAIPINKFKLHLLQCHMDEIAKGLTTLQEGINAKKWTSGESECSLCLKSVDNLQLHMMAEHPSATLYRRLPPQTSEQDLEAALTIMSVGMDVLWKGKTRKRKHQCCAYCDKSYLYSTRQTELRNHILEKHYDQVLKTLNKIKPNSIPAMAAMPDPVQPTEVEESPKAVKEHSVKNIMPSSRNPAQIPIFVRDNVLRRPLFPTASKSSSLTDPSTTDTRPLPQPQPTIIHQPQANEPRLKSVLRSLSSSSSTLLKSSNSSSLNQCPHCGTLFPFKSSLNAHLTSAHPFQLYVNRLPPGTNDNDFDKAIDHLLDQPQADSFLSDQLGCRICASSPVALVAVQTFPDRSYLKRHLLGRHLDNIIERLSEADTEIREEVPLPLEVKIEESDMTGEVKVEENEDLTIHPEQDPLAI